MAKEWIDWLGDTNKDKPLFLTVPHSGELVPPEAEWLRRASEKLLLTDVDRFVDDLYRPAAESLPLPMLRTRVHRYAVDLNRYPDDIDPSTVQSANVGTEDFSRGFHWRTTTLGDALIPAPITMRTHEELVAKYHDPFHVQIEGKVRELRTRWPGSTLYHLDCHSMPSRGTAAHKDGGQKRADVVISDFDGKSCSRQFSDLVIGSFKALGWDVAYNWPYKGGRITQRYGRPDQGHETIQIELNRRLYMSEITKEKLPGFSGIQQQLLQALNSIVKML